MSGCLMTITSVTLDPVSGNMHIHGGSEGCPSNKIAITVTCGGNTYTATALVGPGFTYTAVISGAACGCGQPIKVVAVCADDPSCITAFTTNNLCCCPQ